MPDGPKQWSPRKSDRASYEVSWSDVEGAHRYLVEMSEEASLKLKAHFAELRADEAIEGWSVTRVVPEMDYAGFMAELGRLFE